MNRFTLLGIAVTFFPILIVGCATNPLAVQDQQREQLRNAIETANRQAKEILVQAQKDVAFAKDRIETTPPLEESKKSYPIRNLADVYREKALQFRSAALYYARLAAQANYIAQHRDDPIEKEKWTQRATEYGEKVRSHYRLMRHHADLAAHPEKIEKELNPPSP